jgi:hypothetical protein
MVKKKFHKGLGQTALQNCRNLGSDRGNTDHRDWPELGAKDLRRWDEFNSRTFKTLYRSLWKLSVNCPSLKTPPRQMTHITGEDSIEKLLAAVFQINIGIVLEDISNELGREIWLGATSLCDFGSSVRVGVYKSLEWGLFYF